MRAALLITLKDLRQRVRDRSFLIAAIVAPLCLALLFGFILGEPEGQEEYQFQARYAVVDLDDAPLSNIFTEGLQEIPGSEVTEVATVDRAAELTEGDPNPLAGDDPDEIHAAFVIPAGFTDDVQSERPVELGVISNRQAPFEASTAVSIAEGFASTLTSVRVVTATFENLLGQPVDRFEVGEQVLRGPDALEIEAVPTESTALLDGTYYAVGMTIFFLFFAVQFGVLNLLHERHDGTLRRLLAAPVPRASIIGGKMLTSILAGLVSGTVLVVATTRVVDADWGDSLGVALLLFAFVVAIAGIVALVTGFAHTAGQAQFVATQIGTVLGILGGAFFPVVLSGWLEHLRVISPHRWFFIGIEDLRGGELSVVVQPVAILLAIGIVTFTLALAGIGRRLQP